MSQNEKCPACGSVNFAVARDLVGTRICSSCRHRWLPKPVTAPAFDLDKIKKEGIANAINHEIEARLGRINQGCPSFKQGSASLTNYLAATRALLNEIEELLAEREK